MNMIYLIYLIYYGYYTLSKEGFKKYNNLLRLYPAAYIQHEIKSPLVKKYKLKISL